VIDLLISFMDGRNAAFSQPEFLTTVAQLEVNQLAIDLVGLQAQGLVYTEISL